MQTELEKACIKNALEVGDEIHGSFSARDVIMQEIGAEWLLGKAREKAANGSVRIEELEALLK